MTKLFLSSVSSGGGGVNLPSQVGQSGKVLGTISENLSWISLSGAGSSVAGFDWIELGSNFTAESNKGYYIDTSLGDITMGLPLNPSPGDEVAFMLIKGSSSSYKLNITTSDNIKGAALATDFVKQTGQQYLLFVLFYVDATTGWNWDARYDSYIGNAYVGPGDPLGANVVLFIKGNGINNSTAIVDNSPTPKTLTRYGDVKNSTAQSKYNGSSLLFDGNGDYLELTNNLALLSGKFTIEAWIYPLSAADMTIASSTPNTAGTGRLLGIQADRKVFFSAGGGFGLVASTALVNLNHWNHVAAMVTGTFTYLCVNGVSQSVTNISGTTEGAVWQIGRNARPSDYLYWFNGYMGPIRITKGVDRPYTANFDPESIIW